MQSTTVAEKSHACRALLRQVAGAQGTNAVELLVELKIMCCACSSSMHDVVLSLTQPSPDDCIFCPAFVLNAVNKGRTPGGQAALEPVAASPTHSAGVAYATTVALLFYTYSSSVFSTYYLVQQGLSWN